MTIDPAIIERLKEAAGDGGWSEDAAEIAPHLKEWRSRWVGRTPLLLKPASTGIVSRILTICNETGTPIVPQGGNTGLVGAQIPTEGEVLLTCARMNRIRRVSPDENLLIAESGVVLMEAQKAAAAVNRLFPLSLGAEGSCTIGGNISTNAGGVNVLRYGMMRALVMGVEVVLADGRVLELMRGLAKDNTGYDLKQLFIGAEGTLGIVTAAMLKLFPKPASFATLTAGLTGLDHAVPLLNRLQDATGGMVTAFELIPQLGFELVTKHIPATTNPLPAHKGWSVLIEVSNASAFDATHALEEGLARAMDDGLVADAVFAKSARDRDAMWRVRETLPEAQRAESSTVANDVTVPQSLIPQFIRAASAAVIAALPGARPYPFGHVGDGNIHFAILAPVGDNRILLDKREMIERIVQDEASRLHGSISAEHGLGLAKRDDIARYKSKVELDVMRALKRTLDPNNILNRGKTLPAN